MGAYKRDVVVVIKMGASWGACGCLLSRFYGAGARRCAYFKEECPNSELRVDSSSLLSQVQKAERAQEQG